jgi:PEP-CTERM motif
MRFTPLLAAIGAVFAMGSAQAIVVGIDNFNNPFNSTFSTGTGLTATSGSLVTGPNNLATSRIITNRIDTAAVVNATGTLSSIGVGPSPNFFANALNVANANGIQSVNTVTWTLNTPAVAAALTTSSPVSLFFDVILSDTGFPSADTRLDFELIDAANVATSFKTIFIPSSGAAQYSFLLDNNQRTALSTGSRLRLTISGAPGYDFSLDAFGLDLPEPTSVALVGLALVGAGVASRRRKAA